MRIRPFQKKHTAKAALIGQPDANFETPMTLVASPILTQKEKGEALKNWAEDAERLSVAANEGMTGGERSLLPEIKAAEAVLETQIGPEPATASPQVAVTKPAKNGP